MDGQPPRRFAATLLAPVTLIVLWELLRNSKGGNTSLLPPLGIVLLRVLELSVDADFLRHWVASLGRVLAGFSLAASCGVVAGIVMGSHRYIYRVLVPAVDFFRSIPVTTLYPVFVLTVGIGDVSKVAMIATACVFVMALNAAYGVVNGSQTRRALAKLYGASRLQVLRRVVIMEALPQIMVGLRVTISLALIVAILVEMFMGASVGLGQRIMETYSTYLLVDMYSLIILAGLTGYALNGLIGYLERRLVPWAGVREP